MQSQNIPFCGVMSPHTATSTNLDSIVYDRFGNSYDRYQSNNFYFEGSPVLVNIGHFTLNFYDIDATFIPIITNVFEELSDLIIQRSLSTTCGTPITQDLVNIEIRYNSDLEYPVAATGTPFYNTDYSRDNCTYLQSSRPFIKLNGMQIYDNQRDGLIDINPDISNFDVSYPNPMSSPLNIDLYTVILHEALHILAFHPRTEMQNPIFFSEYDFLLLGNNSKIIDSNCETNCFDSHLMDETIPNCNIRLGSSGPFVASINNLAHLSGTDSGCGSDLYVMNPGIDLGVRKMIQPAEKGVLCDLGYETESCDGNFIIPSETFFYSSIGECPEFWYCCKKIYTTCENTIEIPVSDLLCTTRGNINYEITDVFTVFPPNSTAILNISNGIITVTNTNNLFSLVNLVYTVTNDQCFSLNGNVSIIFDRACQQYNCQVIDECQNILCYGDFENLTPLSFQSLGYPFVFEGTCQNTPDISGFPENSTNNSLHIGVNGDEGAVLQLNNVPYNNCALTLTFDAAYKGDYGPATLEVWGSTFPPCHYNDTPVPKSCIDVTVECENGNVYHPICLGSFPLTTTLTNYIELIETSQYIPDEINYLIFSYTGTVDVFIDNTNLIANCADASFTIDNNCPLFSFNSTEIHGDETHFWDFGDDITSNEQNPSHLYANEGTFIVTHTITDQCGNMQTSTDEVLVDFPLASFVFNDQYCPNLNFISTSIGSSLQYSWNFGDGSTSTHQLADHTYNFPGTYTVTLTVTNNCGSSSISHIVEIDCATDFFPCFCPVNLNSYNIFNPSNPNGTINITDTDLPINGLAGACVAIYGNLLINLPPNSVYNITYCNFKMQPGSSITIPSGVTVRMDNTFFEGCETMWRSIVVEDGGVLSAEICVFKDAEYTIDAKNGSWINLADNTFLRNYVSLLDGAGQSTFTIGAFSGNTFHCDDCSTTNPMLPPTTIGLIPTPGIRSYTGILIDNNAGITLGTGTGVETNIFRNMANGIVADRVNLTVENCRFENMLTGGGYDANNQSGYGIMAKGHSYFLQQTGLGKNSNIATFHNCQNSGIYTYRTNLNVTENKMTQMDNGIIVNQSPHVNIVISENNISATKRGIACINTDDAGILDINNNDIVINSAQLNNNVDVNGIYIGETGGASSTNRSLQRNEIEILNRGNGIHLLNVNFVSVSDVTINFTNGTTAQGTGILMDGSDDNHIQCNKITGSNINTQTTAYSQKTGAGNTIHCNTTDLTRVGFRFTGMCVGTDFATNTIGRHQDGLLMTASAAFGDNNDENVQDHNGNLWVGDGDTDYYEVEDYSDKASKHQGGFDQVFFSKFLVNTDLPPIFTPSIQSALGWFNIDAGDSDVCVPSLICQPLQMLQMLSVTPLEKALIMDEMNVLQFDEGVKWETQKKVYEKLLKDPNLFIQDAELEAFKISHENLPVGKFATLNEETKNALFISDYVGLILDQKSVYINDIQSDIKALEAQVYPDMSESAYTNIKTQINSLHEILKIAVVDKDDLITGIKVDKDSDIALLIPENNSIQVSETYDANEKTVNSIFFEMHFSEAEFPSEEQISLLTPIAEQCPLSGGKAVLKARAILSLVSDVAYDDEDICLQAGVAYLVNSVDSAQHLVSGNKVRVEKSLGRDNDPRVKVFPVPTEDKLYIASNLLINQAMIVDLLGKVLLDNTVMDTSIEINVSNLAAGIYTCYITLLNGETVKHKIIITH